MTNKELIQKAREARGNSYSPYSNFKVGAALLTKSGKVFFGTNVENASFSLCNCAERSAIFSAISNGENDFVKMAIIGNEKRIIYPCGACRQVIYESASNIEIICAKNDEEYEILTIEDLLPKAFGKKNKE